MKTQPFRGIMYHDQNILAFSDNTAEDFAAAPRLIISLAPDCAFLTISLLDHNPHISHRVDFDSTLVAGLHSLARYYG